MAYYRCKKPEKEQVEKHIESDIERITQDLNKNLLNLSKCDKILACEHNWEMSVEESFDGHRTDRQEVWTCLLCKYQWY